MVISSVSSTVDVFSPALVDEMKTNISQNAQTITAMSKYKFEFLRDEETIKELCTIESNLRGLSNTIQNIVGKGIPEMGLELSRDVQRLVSQYENFKRERKIVEFTQLSFGGKILRFLRDTLPRALGLSWGYTYIHMQNQEPLDIAKTKGEVDTVICKLYLEAAPKGKSPTTPPTGNVWGIEEEEGSRVRIWLAKTGKEVQYPYEAEITNTGIQIKGQGFTRGETFATWQAVADKVKQVAQLNSLTDIGQMGEKARLRLQQFMVKKPPALVGKEWCVTQEGNSYRLYGPGPGTSTQFFISGDGYSTQENGPTSKNIQELFPNVEMGECLVRKFAERRRQTYEALVERGITARYKDGKIEVEKTFIEMSPILQGKGSFFVVEDETQGFLVTFDAGVLTPKRYEIQEDGSVLLKDNEKVDLELVPKESRDVENLRFEVEKTKLKAVVSRSQEGLSRFVYWEKPTSKALRVWNYFSEWGSQKPYGYSVEIPSLGGMFLPISVKESENCFEVTFANETPIRAKTIEQLKIAIDKRVQQKLDEALQKERRGKTEELLRQYANPFTNLDALEPLCQALKNEGEVQPWCVEKSSSERYQLSIRYGSRPENTLPFNLVKRGNIWRFECDRGSFATLQEMLQAKNLRIQDNPKELVERKDRREKLINELTGERFLQKVRGRKHDFFTDNVSDVGAFHAGVEAKAREKRNTVAAVYMKGDRYFLAESPHGGKCTTTEISIRTWPTPLLVCGERRGTDLSQILPLGTVMSLNGLLSMRGKPQTDGEVFSMYGDSFFTSVTSFAAAKERCDSLMAKIPENRRLLVIFRDPSQKYCFYMQPKGGPAQKGFIELDGAAVELFDEFETTKCIGSYGSFIEWCQEGDFPAVSIAEVEEAARPATQMINPATDFLANGKQFYIARDSLDTLREDFEGVAGRVPEGKRLVGVFKEGDHYLLCTLLRGQDAPQFHLLEKGSDGKISLSLRGGERGEEFKNFAALCDAINGLPYEEIKTLSTPTSKKETLQGAVWGEWLDDSSDRLSDKQVKKEFGKLVRAKERPTTPHAFRVWVKGLAIARTKDELAQLNTAKGLMRTLPIVDQFWLHELALGSTVVQEGSDRQRRAIAITSEVLLESLKDPQNKNALLAYFEGNRNVYGTALPELLVEIKTAFTPEEQKRLGISQ